jgi:hypothetical protein
MKTLQIVLVTIALVVAIPQTVRHAYVMWVEPRHSVLTEYETTQKQIMAAKSLEDLVRLYEEVRAKVKKIGKDEFERDKLTKEEAELFERQRTLRSGIEEWERHHKEIYEVHFFWWCGLAVLLVGLGTYYWVNDWLGMAGIICGFAEMTWWTSPSIRALGAEVEFDRLLLLKFIYSILTFVLLVSFWLFFTYPFKKRSNEPQASVNERPIVS